MNLHFIKSRRAARKQALFAAHQGVKQRLFVAGHTLDKAELLELYKIMVASSESLVARRQTVNALFVTLNGFVLTAAGVVVKTGGGDVHQRAGSVLLIALGGLVMCWAWRTLLISFGQLNTGKFAVITEIENHLTARIYDAEWTALGEGKDARVYRSFTSREVWIPTVLITAYIVVMIVAGAATDYELSDISDAWRHFV